MGRRKRVFFSCAVVVFVLSAALLIGHRWPRSPSTFTRRTGIELGPGMKIINYRRITWGFDPTVAWQISGTDQQFENLLKQYAFDLPVGSQYGVEAGKWFGGSTRISDYPFAWKRQWHACDQVLTQAKDNSIYLIVLCN